MSTRSSARNLFPPLDNPELIIRRRSRTNSEMAAEGNGDIPVPDLRTMEELCQPSLNGRVGPIALISIQATNFRLKNDMIQQVQNSCQFHGLPGDDANKHLDKFLHVSQSIKVNGVTNDALHLYLFPHSLTHHATARFDRLPRNLINTFEQMAKMFLDALYNGLTLRHRDTINAAIGGTFMKRRPGECFDLIENMITHHNDWDTSAQRSKSSSSITSSFDTEITALKAKMAEINKNLMRVFQVNQQVKAVDLNCETCGGPHSFSDCLDNVGNTQNVYAIPQEQVFTNNEFTNFMKANDAILKNMQTNMTSLTNSNLELKNMFSQFMKMNTASSSGSRTLPGNTITNPKEDMKSITTCSGTAYQGPTIPTASSSSPVVERETERLIVAPIIEPVASPNKLSLPDLSPTCMTLELADRSISRPVGVAEDVFVKVGTFHFLADFVVVYFDADPRVPLILERSFLKTKIDLIDVFKGELTLRVGHEAITFNHDQTSRYSANYNDMTANRIDVNDMACEEYSQEVLGFYDMITSGNPTPYYDLIVSTTSSTFTPFDESDFLLKEVDEFLALEDDLTSPKVDQSYVDTEGDILFLEAFLNDDPSVEVKDLHPHLEFAFLESDNKLPVIIAKDLSMEEKTALITVLKSHNQAIAWKLSDIKENEDNELISTRLVTRWCVCIDYHKLNEATRKDHFPLPFIDQMLERLAGNKYYCFLDDFSGYFQIPIDPKDQEKTTFTCSYETFSYRCMPFGLCNVPGTFQRCMMAIFHDMIEKTMEVFMDDFLVFRNSFQTCLSYLERMLKQCEDTNLCLNWEKSHFMVKEGIVLGHKISREGIDVDKAKVDVISKFPHPTTVKGIRSFLGHAGVYRRFIQDFSKIAQPMTRLLEKDTPFLFSKECVEAFQTLKRKLTEAPILIAPD
uniref:Reverse transcriptase domain-containing protein n=1 Tax=Tanacetum cinerariifolium TaxID=118510 RepID=A0A699HT48_TANCI|nr:reverse transcriptase domain-containing protein [Tanacetum cinerariifolium]